MGLFSKAKSRSNNTQVSLSREEILARNAGVSFTTEIIDDRDSETLSYKYDMVKCNIIGNISGLSTGLFFMEETKVFS